MGTQRVTRRARARRGRNTKVLALIICFRGQQGRSHAYEGRGSIEEVLDSLGG